MKARVVQIELTDILKMEILNGWGDVEDVPKSMETQNGILKKMISRTATAKMIRIGIGQRRFSMLFNTRFSLSWLSIYRMRLVSLQYETL